MEIRSQRPPGPVLGSPGDPAPIGIAPWDIDAILAARAVFDEKIKEGFPGLIDYATESPRRIRNLIGGVFGAAGALVIFGWILGRRP